MPKYLILFFIITIFKVSGQNSFCLLEFDDNINNLKKNDCTFSACEDSITIYKYFPIPDLELKTIKLRWILFSDDDGKNGLDENLIWNYIPILNSAYSESKIQFDVFDIVKHNNSEINHADRNEWEHRVDFYQPYVKYQNELVNIFVTKEFGNWDNRGFATLPFDIPILDYYTFPERNGVVVINQLLITPQSEIYNHGVPHEIGHILGLMHPNLNNADCQNECNETISTQNYPKANYPYRTGDFVSDTYPHPNTIYLPYNDGPCEFDSSQNIIDDCTGLTFYNPLLNMQNYMGYYINCNHHFTNEQILRMHCFLENYYPNFINEFNSNEEHNNPSKIVIYPNPNNGNFEFLNLNLNEELKIVVWNISGEQILDIPIRNSNHIDLQILYPGIYIVGIHNLKNKEIFKDKMIIIK